MPHYLFTDFLADRGKYASAQRYWENLWQEVPSSEKLEAPWIVNWMKNPLPDGNPMFTAVCQPLRKGVRIIQEEPRDPNDIDLDWWLDVFGDADGAVQELVIACCPSVQNIPRIRQLLKQWTQGEDVALPQSNGIWNESA